MRKLGRSSDSLELLLDTVCSMFGAILLIAILVALMAQTAKVDSPGEQAGAEMLRRKIATAEADLAETQRLRNELAIPSDNSAAALASEKKQMEAALAAARAQRDQMAAQLQDQVVRQAVDYSAEWKTLTARLRGVQRRLEEVENDIKAREQNTTRMNDRVADISASIQQEKDARVITLRFPKERARTKKALPVICKFGKIYPVMDADGHENGTTISWTAKGRGKLSRPVEALGWTVEGNKTAIDQLLRSIPRGEVYLAFYVYPDSFDAFRGIRDQATASQIEFGVELDRAGSDLIWGSEGTTPPPL